MTLNKNRKALGRGLSNLIPMDGADTTNEAEIFYIELDSLIPNPFQPRKDFNDNEINGLAESIKNQGLLQPLVVRRQNSNKYEIISGERRYRALKILQHDKVPCLVKSSISDSEMLEIAIVENIQREDLNEIECAYAYQRLMFECGLSHQQLSERIGKSRSVITNTLRLLKLPEQLQKMLRDSIITMGHARALLSVDEEHKQLELAQRIIDEHLSVREIEQLTQLRHVEMDNQQDTKEDSKRRPIKCISPVTVEDPDTVQQLERLRYRYGTDVHIRNSRKWRGAVEITFYSKEDLNRLLDLLMQQT